MGKKEEETIQKLRMTLTTLQVTTFSEPQAKLVGSSVVFIWFLDLLTCTRSRILLQMLGPPFVFQLSECSQLDLPDSFSAHTH